MTLIDTLLKYGRGPIIRGLIWALVALFGKYGVDSAKAGDLANTIWPALSGIALAVSSLVWSVQSDKALSKPNG